jgi:hypothetical protein
MTSSVGERKTFTTTIRADIQKRFRMACVQKEMRMNDILEVLMEGYASDQMVEQYVASELKRKSGNK